MEYILFVIGITLIPAGIYLILETAGFRKTAYRIPGTVVAIEKYFSNISSNISTPNSKTIY